MKALSVFRSAVCSLICLAAQLLTAAQDIYMFIGDGSGGGDGTQGNPYDVSTTNLFELRLAQAASCSIVRLASGIYKRVSTSDTFVNNSISIVGAGSSLTTIINLSAPSGGNGITVLALYGDVTVKGLTLNCNSTNWPSVGRRYNGLYVEGSAVVDDVIVRNARGDWAGGAFESFPLILTHTSSIPSSFNNISVLEVKADVGSTRGWAYVSPLTAVNYTDQFVYITNLYIDTGTNRAVCAFAPYGRNYVVRNVSNSGFVSSGIWGDADGNPVSVHTIENVDWVGGRIIAKVPIRFGVNLPLRLRVSNVRISDVECDHGPADNWDIDPPNGWDEVEAILLSGTGTEVDGLFVNRLKCSWPAVTLPYSTTTYPYWHMGVVNIAVTNFCKNIVIEDSVFIPAHTASGHAPFRNWVHLWPDAPVPITPPTLINCRDTQNRFYSDNWSGGDLSFADATGNKLFGTDAGSFFVMGVLRAGSANTQVTDSTGKVLNQALSIVDPAHGGLGQNASTLAANLFPYTTGSGIAFGDYQTVRSALQLVPGQNVQTFNSSLNTIAELSTSAGNLIAGNGSAWTSVAISQDGSLASSGALTVNKLSPSASAIQGFNSAILSGTLTLTASDARIQHLKTTSAASQIVKLPNVAAGREFLIHNIGVRGANTNLVVQNSGGVEQFQLAPGSFTIAESKGSDTWEFQTFGKNQPFTLTVGEVDAKTVANTPMLTVPLGLNFVTTALTVETTTLTGSPSLNPQISLGTSSSPESIVAAANISNPAGIAVNTFRQYLPKSHAATLTNATLNFKVVTASAATTHKLTVHVTGFYR
jgi:hypothetical protein